MLGSETVKAFRNLEASGLEMCYSLQEKQKLKIKEKLDKCVKEKLIEICDVLDIAISKANTRKVSCFLCFIFLHWGV